LGEGRGKDLRLKRRNTVPNVPRNGDKQAKPSTGSFRRRVRMSLQATTHLRGNFEHALTMFIRTKPRMRQPGSSRVRDSAKMTKTRKRQAPNLTTQMMQKTSQKKTRTRKRTWMDLSAWRRRRLRMWRL
jgi:hypothetical protein